MALLALMSPSRNPAPSRTDEDDEDDEEGAEEFEEGGDATLNLLVSVDQNDDAKVIMALALSAFDIRDHRCADSSQVLLPACTQDGWLVGAQGHQGGRHRLRGLQPWR